MTALTTEPISTAAARNGPKISPDTALDPTQRTLILAANQGLKLVKAGDGTAGQLKISFGLQLLLLKLRYLLRKMLSAFLFGFCRLLGEPK